MIVLGEQVVVVGAGAAVQDDHRRAMSHPSRVEADAVQLDRRFGGRLWHRVSTYTAREDEAASLTTRPTRARRRRDPLPSGRRHRDAGRVRARIPGAVRAGGADRPAPRGAAALHAVFVVARRHGARDLVPLRAGVRVGGGEFARRRAAALAAARHPPEHPGTWLSPGPRARTDVAVPGAQYGAGARGDPHDLHRAGVELGALLLQLAQSAAPAAAGRV